MRAAETKLSFLEKQIAEIIGINEGFKRELMENERELSELANVHQRNSDLKLDNEKLVSAADYSENKY